MTFPETSPRVLWELADSNYESHSGIGMAGDFLPCNMLANGGWRAMSAAIHPYFSDLSMAICNLECPLATDGLKAAPLGGLGTLVSAPAETLDFLPPGPLHVLSLANNHAYNYGSEGVGRTVREIRSRGMLPLGSECSLKDPPAVDVVSSAAGHRVGFWAAANITREPATATTRGVDVATRERGLQALQVMKARGAKICIALLHAGLMRTDYPDPADVELMDELAREGFDLIGACHSHRISGYKPIRRPSGDTAFCFYGLGTLAWNYFSSSLEREGLMPVIFLDGRGRIARLELRLIWLADSGEPTIPDRQRSEALFGRFSHISSAICDGSYRQHFYRDVTRGMMKGQWRDTLAAFRDTGIKGIADKLSRVRMRHIRRLAHRLVNL